VRLDVYAHVGAIRLRDRRSSRHQHVFADTPRLQDQIYPGGGVHHHVYIGPCLFLEALGFSGNGIRAWGQIGKGEEPVPIGRAGVRDAGSAFQYLHRRVGHRGTGVVGHITQQGGGYCLAPGHWDKQKNHRREYRAGKP
jgi:hypothetical protein